MPVNACAMLLGRPVGQPILAAGCPLGRFQPAVRASIGWQAEACPTHAAQASRKWPNSRAGFQPALAGPKTRACPKKPPERRLQARLPAPQIRPPPLEGKPRAELHFAPWRSRFRDSAELRSIHEPVGRAKVSMVHRVEGLAANLEA